MRHPVNRELFAYWDSLRAGRSAPQRSAIDPAAISDLLAYTFLLQVDEPAGSGPRAVSFRLSGTRLNALFRRDLKGSAFAALWADGGSPEAPALVEAVLDDSVPIVAGLRGAPADYEPADFELLLLPLRHHGRTHSRLLGSLVAESVPNWIGLQAIDGLRLTSFRTMLPRDGLPGGRFGRGGRCDGEALPPPLRPAASRTGPFKVYQGGRAAPHQSPGPAVAVGRSTPLQLLFTPGTS